MPHFEKCDQSVIALALDLMEAAEEHKPLIDLEVKIDYVFAYGDVNEKGVRISDALKKNGIRAYGITRVIPLKDRVLGRGDAEIALDGDYWKEATAEEQAALLDHELEHVSVACDKHGNVQYDDIGRTKIKLRKHNFEFGWFTVIADRHGPASIERKQAKAIMDKSGQLYWPGIAPTIEIEYQGKKVTTTPAALRELASKPEAFAKAAATEVA